MPQNLTLSVGTSYRNRGGERIILVDVITNDANEPIIYLDRQKRWYLPTGRLNGAIETVYDLVEEITFPRYEAGFYWVTNVGVRTVAQIFALKGDNDYQHISVLGDNDLRVIAAEPNVFNRFSPDWIHDRIEEPTSY